VSHIKFLCPPELEGKIPSPERATKFLPDWFRDLPREMGMKDAHGLPAMTVRACLPVADVMSLGWIIPLPFDISATRDPQSGQVAFDWDDDLAFKPLDMHHPGQVGADKPGPFFGRSALKFINPWRITLPAGWSASFLHPINHFELPFRAFNGAVDCDALDVPVNIPFLWTGIGTDFYLPAGTPMVQVVPYERAATKMTAEVRGETPEEFESRTAALGRKYTEESVYSKEWRRRHERES
jgi:hypothetical protein